uniref:Uncharacterized protein n=1 Tax=Ananas comosus var. bracteatus TaxID=296719 RepID=A0A6V7QD88_ANACO|nr:unnamed protein product [Ananas comosus var. bracteatus]
MASSPSLLTLPHPSPHSSSKPSPPNPNPPPWLPPPHHPPLLRHLLLSSSSSSSSAMGDLRQLHAHAVVSGAMGDPSVASRLISLAADASLPYALSLLAQTPSPTPSPSTPSSAPTPFAPTPLARSASTPTLSDPPPPPNSPSPTRAPSHYPKGVLFGPGAAIRRNGACPGGQIGLGICGFSTKLLGLYVCFLRSYRVDEDRLRCDFGAQCGLDEHDAGCVCEVRAFAMRGRDGACSCKDYW